jgi:hypothetical protein
MDNDALFAALDARTNFCDGTSTPKVICRVMPRGWSG